MKRLLILVGLLTVMGCSTAKYVPVETIERVEYRDSVVYVNDTITIEVPKEKVVYVGPADTLSQISTSLAFSEAKVEQGVLIRVRPCRAHRASAHHRPFPDIHPSARPSREQSPHPPQTSADF